MSVRCDINSLYPALGSTCLCLLSGEWWVCGAEPWINPLAGLTCWELWESGRKLLATEQADITRAETIKVLVVNEPTSAEQTGWAVSASWGYAHCCECFLFCMRRIWRDFGWAFRCGVLLVSRWTALVTWDWAAVAAEPFEPDSEQN